MNTVSARPLLSRVANSVYWLGRYVERADNVARILAVNFHVQLGLRADPSNQWQPMVDTSGDAAVFRQRYGAATQESVIRFLAFDRDNPNSILSCVGAARENARSIREVIPSSMWEQMNALYLLLRAHENAPRDVNLPDFFREVRMACSLLYGITEATMTRDEAYHFLRLGNFLERADKTTRLLDVKYFILLPAVAYVGTPLDDVHWAALLKSAGGFEMYRKRHRKISPPRLVEFLLMDPEFPRSVRFCTTAAHALHFITGAAPGSFSCPSEQLLGRLRAELDFSGVEMVIGRGLHEFLDGLQAKLNTIDDAVFADFFALRTPGVPAAGG
jgi:uncharacterized alpha-E superfamily protein